MKESLYTELGQILPQDRLFADDATRLAHSYDYWPVAVKWRSQGKAPLCPDIVVRPRSCDEVAAVLRFCNAHEVPVTPWGGGSSVTGAPLAARGGISLDLGALDKTFEIDRTNLTVRVGAGKIGAHLERELNVLGLTLKHSPQSLHKSSVGGWLATRATGQFSSRWGSIEDLCLGFTVVLPSGEVVDIRPVPRAAAGPDLRHLFIGAEGTTGVIVEVTLKVFPKAETQLFECVRFPTLEAGLQTARQIMQSGIQPFLLRLYDPAEAAYAAGDVACGSPIMFLGCEGVAAVAVAELECALDRARASGGTLLGDELVLNWMERRFDFSAIESRLNQSGGVAETIEVAHLWSGIMSTYTAMRKELAPRVDEVFGHFSHAYAHGTSLYVILFGLEASDASAERTLLEIWRVAMQAALRTGAVISHHHGIGYARRDFLQAHLGSQFPVLQTLMRSLDPKAILNPDKLSDRRIK